MNSPFRCGFWGFVTSLFGPRYTGRYLRDIIEEILKETRISETLTRIVIPTFDIKLLQPAIFSTSEVPRSVSLQSSLYV